MSDRTGNAVVCALLGGFAVTVFWAGTVAAIVKVVQRSGWPDVEDDFPDSAEDGDFSPTSPPSFWRYTVPIEREGDSGNQN